MAFKVRSVHGLAAATAVLALGVAGCSTSDAPAVDDVEAADSGTVTWWGWSPDTAVAQEYISAFNEDYPEIEVTYTNYENVDFRNTLGPALDSGEGPDVFNLSAAGGSPDLWGPYGVDLAPVAEEALGADWESQFAGGYIDQLRASDGRLVSLPLGGQAAGMMWYNKDIFDEAGAEVPTDYVSWVAACDAITAIGKKCFTMGAGGDDTFPSDMFHSVANSVDPDFFIAAATGEANWDDPEGIATLQIFKDMREDGIIANNALDGPQYPLANEEFLNESAAMVQMGFWYTQYSDAEACLVSMEGAGVSDPECFVQMPMEFPDVAGEGNGSVPFGEVDYGLAINADSSNLGAAKTFVSWMSMNETGQQNVANALDLLPGVQGSTPNWEEIELVDIEVQRPAIEQLIADSTATTQSRQWQTTEETLDAIVLALQQILDPSIDMSVEDIAAQMQAGAVPSDVGSSE